MTGGSFDFGRIGMAEQGMNDGDGSGASLNQLRRIIRIHSTDGYHRYMKCLTGRLQGGHLGRRRQGFGS